MYEFFHDHIKKEDEYIINIDKNKDNNSINNIKLVDFYTAISYYSTSLLNDLQGCTCALGDPIYNYENNIIVLKDVYRHELSYMITSYGDVYSKKYFQKMSTLLDLNGYRYLSLNMRSGKKKEKIHRLVGMTFIPCKNMNNLHINHIDENHVNNYVTNSKFVTPAINVRKYYFKNDSRNPEEIFKIKVNSNVFDTVTDAAKYIASKEPTKVMSSIRAYIANIFYRGKNNKYLNKYEITKKRR